MKDSIRRALRTYFQAFVGVVVMQIAAVGLNVSQGEWVPDIHWLQRVGLSAAVAGAVAFFSWAHNELEDKGTIPAIGKAVPSSGANPVTVDPPR